MRVTADRGAPWRRASAAVRRPATLSAGFSTLQQSVQLVSGAVIGVLLARLLSPQDLGVYSVALSLVAIGTAVASGGGATLSIRSLLEAPAEQRQIVSAVLLLRHQGGGGPVSPRLGSRTSAGRLRSGGCKSASAGVSSHTGPLVAGVAVPGYGQQDGLVLDEAFVARAGYRQASAGGAGSAGGTGRRGAPGRPAVAGTSGHHSSVRFS